MTPYKGRYTVTSAVGWRTYTYQGKKVTDYHNGIDQVGYDTKDQRSIWDTLKNEVVMGYNSGRGNLVRLYYNAYLRVLYQHISKALITANSRVRQGDVVSVEGSTGQSTGSHLHSEVQQLVNGVWTTLSGAYQEMYTEVPNRVTPAGQFYTGNDDLDKNVSEPETNPEPESTPGDGTVWVPRIEIARGEALELFTEPNVEAVIHGNGPGTVHNGTLRIDGGNYIGLERVTLKGMPAAENAVGYKILVGGERLYVATGLAWATIKQRSMEQIIDEFKTEVA